MRKIFLVFLLSSTTVFAQSFLRLESAQPKTVYMDTDKDGVEDQKIETVYDSRINQKFEKRYYWDTVTNAWAISSEYEEAVYDSKLKQLTVTHYATGYTTSGIYYCEIYQLDATESRPEKVYYVYEKDEKLAKWQTQIILDTTNTTLKTN